MSEKLFDNLMNEATDGTEIDPEVYLQHLLEDPNLVQHINRTQSDGNQTVIGYFRVDFNPGQQRSVVHVPFSPPLKCVPHVEAHALDDQSVRVRITDCQKFGLRTEVVLPIATDSGRRLMIEIVAMEAN